VFFGKLIKSAVSRQREFLADASAVQFTRNPLGLAGALKKIGGLSSGSRLENLKPSRPAICSLPMVCPNRSSTSLPTHRHWTNESGCWTNVRWKLAERCTTTSDLR